MKQIQKTKQYDLEERTLAFALRVNEYINRLPRSITNIVNGKQLARSARSVGANYIKANESLGKKDFLMRIRISRKEAKESRFWLNLAEPTKQFQQEKESHIQEATELMKIFGAIVTNAK